MSIHSATSWHNWPMPQDLQRWRGRPFESAMDTMATPFLTTWPVLAVRRLDLSVPGREPRGALDVDLNIQGKTARVIVTHLGLRGAERRHQVKRLIAALSIESAGLVIALGDANEWLPAGRPLRTLHAAFGKTRAQRTFPSVLPFLALDRIWVRPKEDLLDVRPHKTPLARIASDHLPLKALIDSTNFIS